MEKSCTEVGSYMVMGINVAVHVLVLFSILSMFFMFYVAPLERKSLNNEIKKNIYKLITAENIDIPDEIKPLLKSDFIQKLKNQYDKPHESIEAHNNWLFKMIIVTNASLFIIVTMASLLLLFQCGQSLPIGQILLENGLTFTFVGIIEYLFFTKIALHYLPTKPSDMRTSFIESVEKYL